MKSTVASAAFAVALAVTPVAVAADLHVGGSGPRRETSVSGDLATALPRLAAAEKGPVWLAWEVPATSSLRNACCFDQEFHGSVCQLEKEDHGWGSNDHAAPGDGRLRVLARTSGGRIDRVRGVSSTCGIDAGALPFVHVTDVSSDASVAFLAGLVAGGSGARKDDEEDGALAALAFHAGAAAEGAMQRFAAPGQPGERREQALFWIGQARGRDGVRFLAGVARDDASTDIRKKAIFALSQSDAEDEAADTMVDIARRDADPDVRGEALFWLAQTGAPGAGEEVLARVSADPSLEVRKKAIFALTQLPKGGVPLLMRVAREQRQPPELRREAIFWLGQSDDPRALDFFEQVLGKSDG